jgi:hypothetical protein
LATSDARVRLVLADRPGAAAARNAGIGSANGRYLALLDDDCVAAPGWLLAGIEALAEADLVQGRTWPASPVVGWQRTIRVTELSWLWESCNLFVRRSAVEQGGLFDADWRRTGGTGHPWGEDTEWGWRLVRSGARYGFAPDALAHHAVDTSDYWTWLHERTDIRWFPLLVRSTPEVRRRFHRSYFFDRRHLVVCGAAAAALAGGAAGCAGRRRAAHLLLGAAAAAYLAPARRLRDPVQVRLAAGPAHRGRRGGVPGLRNGTLEACRSLTAHHRGRRRPPTLLPPCPTPDSAIPCVSSPAHQDSSARISAIASRSKEHESSRSATR